MGPSSSGGPETRSAEVSSSEVARAAQLTLESSPPEDSAITSTTLPSLSPGTDNVFDRRGDDEEMCITVSVGSESGELDIRGSVSPTPRDRGEESRTAKGKRPVGRDSRRRVREKGGRTWREEGATDGQREEESEEDRGGRHKPRERRGYGYSREGSSRHDSEERERKRKREAHRHSHEKHKRRRSDSNSHRHRKSSRSSSHHSHHSKSKHSVRWSSDDRYSSSELDEDHRYCKERERRKKRRRRRREERDSGYRNSREHSRRRECESPEPYCVRERKHRLRMYSDDYPTATPSSSSVSQVRSKARAESTSSHTRKEREREEYRSRRRRRHLTPDTRTVELREELESVNQQIKQHKTELLGAMLRSERLRLLHRNLRGEDLPSTEVLQRVHGLGQLAVIGEATPTTDVVHELAQLDQAIMDGKRQVLKMMRRMEEEQTASNTNTPGSD